jgi:hypothetical protein
MKYTVDWTDDARDGLTTLWLRAPDRAAVTRASALIDQSLAADPGRNTRPVSEGLFAIDVPPLCATFEVDAAARLVTVVSVGTIS